MRKRVWFSPPIAPVRAERTEETWIIRDAVGLVSV